MRTKRYAGVACDVAPPRPTEMKEIVMGLHWDPVEDRAAAAGATADLDAICVLLDARNEVLAIVDPDHPSNANESVVHTGNSRSGSAQWDNERIFVFLDALPDAVQALRFAVESRSPRALGAIPGAYCHVSDRMTDQPWLRLDLSGLGDRDQRDVAMLRRTATGWNMLPGEGGPNAPA